MFFKKKNLKFFFRDSVIYFKNLKFVKIKFKNQNFFVNLKKMHFLIIFFGNSNFNQKFQFKFRYHDGRIVHFGSNFSFSIELTTLRPDSIKPPIQVQRNCYMLT